MINDKELKELINGISAAGDFSEIYIENTVSTKIKCEDDKIENIVSGTDNGAGIRVIKGEETFFGSTNDVSFKGLNAIIGQLTDNKTADGKIPLVHFKDDIKAENFYFEILADKVPVEEKLKLVKLANDSARAVDKNRIRQVTVGYSDTIKDIEIINSYGLHIKERRSYIVFIVNVIALDKGIMQTGYEPIGGLSGFELFSNYDVEKTAETAALRAVRMLDAKKAPTGEMMVVLSSEAGGTMIHEAIGHSLEADLIQKEISPAYKGRLGEAVASELVTVLDDATLQGKMGSFKYDDEGKPGEKTVLVEKGILKNYMHSYFTAKKENKPSTGNGRRESYKHAPIPRMSNTLILPGNDHPGQIIQSVKKGLYVKKMGGGQVDTANGNFVFDVAEGYEIVDGRLGDIVRGATFMGNGPQVLKSIDMVGNDLGFGIGTCGKDGQGVPVGDAQPTLRIPRITVGGTDSNK
jgi:TldD protein